MTQEEKAKRYDEALERVRDLMTNQNPPAFNKDLISLVFPELAESEDEKIRKDCIKYLDREYQHCPLNEDKMKIEKCIAWLEKQGGITKLSEEEQNRFAKVILTSCALSFIDYLDAHKYEGKMCVSNDECEDIENAFHNAMWDKLHRYYCKYIEKQGEQKDSVVGFKAKDWYVSKVDGKIHNIYSSVDKAEPKFKVGDWVVRGKSIVQISDIQGRYYIGTDIYGNDLTSRSDKIHLWTIQDAKDGDVLVNGSNIFIFHFLNDTRLMGYCHVNLDDGKFYDDIGRNECFCLIDAEVTPATKKQRDLLFQKLKEARYEWDSEKKELKKIMQSSAWNEEDENFFNDTVAFFEYKNALDCRDWLKSLKQRLGG